MANVSQNLPASAQAGAVDKKEAKRRKKEERAAARKERGITPARAGLLVFLFMMFLIMACAAALYTDFMGVRQIAVNLLLEGRSPYDPQIERLEELTSSLAAQSAALETRTAELEAEQKRLDKLDKTLTAKEAQLNTREEQLDASTSLATASEENITQLVAIYEKMDAAQAARVMEELYDVEDAARILSRMKQSNAAGILAAMNAERAARVTELLLE